MWHARAPPREHAPLTLALPVSQRLGESEQPARGADQYVFQLHVESIERLVVASPCAEAGFEEFPAARTQLTWSREVIQQARGPFVVHKLCHMRIVRNDNALQSHRLNDLIDHRRPADAASRHTSSLDCDNAGILHGACARGRDPGRRRRARVSTCRCGMQTRPNAASSPLPCPAPPRKKSPPPTRSWVARRRRCLGA